MAELHDFFAASVGSAAALIGLLFVAISISPERVFGANAEADRRNDAQNAFAALTNVFFVSLVALIPNTLVAIEVIAALAAIRVVRAGIITLRREGSKGWAHFGILSLLIYGFEIYSAHAARTDAGWSVGIVYIVLGLYAYALGTSWGLLGAKDTSKTS